MLSNLLRKIQKLAAVGAVSVCAAGSATAGLFCNMECCQQARPYFSPACEPAWGYHQTCWRKFPELEPCSGWGDYCPSCETGGGIVNANGYETQIMPPQGSPVLQGTPMVIPQPTQNYDQPMQNHAPQPMQSYDQPMQSSAPQPMQSYDYPMQSHPQPMQSYGQPMQNQAAPAQNYAPPVPNYPQPMQSVPNYNSAPSTLTPIPIPEGEIPSAGRGMPPTPNSAMMQQQQLPGNYCPVVTQQPQGYPSAQGNFNTGYTAQGLPPANATQGLPVQSASFNRVRPTTSQPVAQPKRTLLQRILPGGK